MDETERRTYEKYKDIIDAKRPDFSGTLSVADRAAQFLSFEALTGFEDVLDDTSDAHLSGVAAEIEKEEFIEAP